MTEARPTPRIQRRVFVVGAPRSGTTLVQSLLAAHGGMTSFTESHFFDRHFRLLPASSWAVLIRDPAPGLRRWLEENGEQAPAAAEGLMANRADGWRRAGLPLRTGATARRLLRVLDELALRRGRSGWIEKTPRHLRYAPFLERSLGTAAAPRFVHVIRDGLEVAASLRRASRGWERPYDLETCARRWNTDVAFSLRRVGSPNDRFVFYEELTADPEAALRRLVTGLGLDWQPAMLEGYAEASGRLVAPGEEAWKADLGRPIERSATAGTELTDEERRRARRLLRGGLYEDLRERARLEAVGS